jgi:hypothetical protein
MVNPVARGFVDLNGRLIAGNAWLKRSLPLGRLTGMVPVITASARARHNVLPSKAAFVLHETSSLVCRRKKR